MPKNPFVMPGYWQHWKGRLCYVLGTAVSSENPHSWEVVYYSFQAKTWLRRPLYDVKGRGLGKDRCGWLDPVNRHNYQGARYTLLASVIPSTPQLPDFGLDTSAPTPVLTPQEST